MTDCIEYPTEIRVSPSVEALKMSAYRDEEMPEGITSAAQKFFLKARVLYKTAIDPDRGRREMVELERTYKFDKQAEKSNYEIVQLWKRIAPYAKAYSDSRTVETADKFYAAVYRLPDDWRLHR